MIDSKEVHILHVEDDDICLMMLRRMFKKAHLTNPIQTAHDGVDALDRLRGTNGRERLPRPHIIFLDLNMPRMGGIEFLRALRQDEELKTSVVFILTTSNADEDRIRASHLGVAGYILKTNPEQPFLAFKAYLEAYQREITFAPG